MACVKKFFLSCLPLVILVGCGVSVLPAEHAPSNTVSMRIASPAFEHEENIPAQYTCDGADINPPLNFFEVPETAQSLALVVDDPDAPGGRWVHWTVWNMEPSTTSGIGEGEVPLGGIIGTTDFGNIGWGGPCPPSGIHRYFFKLIALDTVLSIPKGASAVELESAIAGHVIAESSLMGRYKRQ